MGPSRSRKPGGRPGPSSKQLDHAALLPKVWASISDGICVVDAGGRATFANPALLQWVNDQGSFLPAAGTAALTGVYLPDAQTPFPAEDSPLRRALKGDVVDHVEMCLRNSRVPEGLWVTASARPLNDGRGKLAGAVMVLHDVTEHRRLEEQRRQRLENLIHAGIRLSADLNVGSLLQQIADAARQVIGSRYAALGVMNKASTAVVQFVTSGVTPEEHARIGRLPTDKGILGLLVKETRPLRLRDLQEHPRSVGFPMHHPPMKSFLGVPITGRRGALGSLYLADKEGAPEFGEEDERIAVMLAALAGVAVENATLWTELRDLQDSRNRFYAMVNHELRNALTGVFGWSELLLRKLGPEPVLAATEVYEAAERTLGLINDLLDLTKLDAAKLKPVVRPTDAAEIVDDAVRTLAAQARRGVQIQVLGAEGPIPCTTDRQRVRQILVSLLSNALRHSPDQAMVTLRVRADEQKVQVEVVDRGGGISPEHQAVIFDAFTQAKSSELRGTGLGLTLSRQLARLLAGDLRVRSAVGAGATFIFEFARHLPSEQA